MSVLSVQDLRVHYRSDRGVAEAVRGATFEVPKGQVVSVVGESGCGKTTLARAIIGVLPNAAWIAGGRLIFQGVDLLSLSPSELASRRWRDIAFIPQSAMNSLDPVYRLGTQVEEVLIDRGGMDKRAAKRRAAELFDMVGLDPIRLRDFPHQFSGGMRQRAAIALALALRPSLVIADEPVTALDVIIQRQILDTFKTLQTELGLSVILITHDISVVAYASDRVVVMYAGEVVESGATSEVLGRPFHPYTMGLYKAFPDLHEVIGTLVPIEGSPPDLVKPPVGCAFADRCPFTLSDCLTSRPPTLDVGNGGKAACLRAPEAERLRLKAGEPTTWLRL
ncbi:MAG: ABC transporter ATP-binding protein [Proteobacteria bacterium]|nr:ABC transporter ATP-binding protein [Pseudomonadota bacterium]MBI3496115.1 ABC transporter ATP-binding protein [Pseudomonadota bacterium]